MGTTLKRNQAHTDRLHKPTIGADIRPNRQQHQLIIADGLCPQIAKLLPGALHEVVALDQCVNPLAAISAILEERRTQGDPIQTLHIIAHGKPGEIHLGGSQVNTACISSNKESLRSWHTETIKIWSCEAGQDLDFIDQLANSTNAEVCAAKNKLNTSSWEIYNNINPTKSSHINEAFKASRLNLFKGSLALVSLPFDDGFVGDPGTGNKAINVTRLNTGNSFGWSNLQFIQESDAVNDNGNPIYKEIADQGNDIVGSVIITDWSGTKHTINGFVNWRQTSRSTVETAVFETFEAKTLATSSSGDYAIGTGDYIGLTFNGFDPET